MKLQGVNWRDLPALKPCVLTLGTFDGLHLAHKGLLQRLCEQANAHDLSSVLLSFEPHPRDLLNGKPPVLRLSTLEEKRELLSSVGVDHVLILEFDHELAALDAQDFACEVLARLNMRRLIIGHNHAFGKGRSGNQDTLAALAEHCSFDLEIFEAVNASGLHVSSTRIREALKTGETLLAADLLGRPYSLEATVVKGHGRGQKIGFPTANLDVRGERKLLPLDGVYAARAWLDGHCHEGMLNLGTRPSFNEAERVPELHLFDFCGDLYGRRLKLEFLLRVRDTVKFDSVSELREQLKSDRHRIQDWLSSRG